VNKGNPAQSPPDGFARNLLADFPSYCPEIPCQTPSLPAEFLGNLPKKSDYASYAQALCGVAQEKHKNKSLHCKDKGVYTTGTLSFFNWRGGESHDTA
ncbi:hypothetical protein, partial [Ruminococcus sp.]